MSIEQNTGNAEKLPLAERARRGLLGDALELHEVMTLEFPTATSYQARQQPRYKDWQAAIEAAIRFGLLGAMEDPRRQVVMITGIGQGKPPTDHYGTVTYYWIDRASYQAWRMNQADKPAGSFITLWLGAMPALPESILPVETSLPELPCPALPATVAQGGAAEKKAALLTLLDEVDKRAAEQDKGFNRHCLPGTKAEFLLLAIAFNRRAFSVATATFDGYLNGQCQFQPGAKPDHGKGAAVWALFPEYRLKLG